MISLNNTHALWYLKTSKCPPLGYIIQQPSGLIKLKKVIKVNQVLVTTQLSLRNRLYPRNGKVENNSDDTDDPEDLWEVGCAGFDGRVAEYDGEYLGGGEYLFLRSYE
jgi:hypothetical protein